MESFKDLLGKANNLLSFLKMSTSSPFSSVPQSSWQKQLEAGRAILSRQWPDPSTLSLAEIYDLLKETDPLQEDLYPQFQTGSTNSNVHHVTREDLSRTPMLLEAANQVENFRMALRSQALLRFKETSRSVTLCSLSCDLLYEIYRYFDLRDWDEMNLDEVHEKSAILRNSRLACHFLKEIASSFLIPILKLSIDQDSLQLARNISSNPQLARGVFKLMLRIDIWSKTLATDFATFQKLALFRLMDALPTRRSQMLPWPTMSRTLPTRPDCVLETEAPGGVRCTRRLSFSHLGDMTYLNRYNMLRDACCLTIPEVTSREQVGDRNLMWRSYRRYGRLREESNRLSANGFFFQELASLMKLLPNCTKVILLLPLDGYRTDAACAAFAALIADPQDTLQLEKLLATPQMARDGEATVGIAESDLVTGLPIAMYKQGAPLLDLTIGVSPFTTYEDVINWEDFARACASLTKVACPMVSMCKSTASIRTPGIQKAFQGFFTALLAPGRALVSCELDGSVITDLQRGQDFKTTYSLVPALARIEWSNLQHLKLSNFCARAQEIESLCESLKPSLRQLWLMDIDINPGSWRRTIDILHQHIASRRCGEGKIDDLRLGGLIGGEFGYRNDVDRYFTANNLNRLTDGDWAEQKRVAVHKQLQLFIEGRGVSENPIISPLFPWLC